MVHCSTWEGRKSSKTLAFNDNVPLATIFRPLPGGKVQPSGFCSNRSRPRSPCYLARLTSGKNFPVHFPPLITNHKSPITNPQSPITNHTSPVPVTSQKVLVPQVVPAGPITGRSHRTLDFKGYQELSGINFPTASRPCSSLAFHLFSQISASYSFLQLLTTFQPSRLGADCSIRILGFGFLSSFGLRHSSFRPVHT